MTNREFYEKCAGMGLENMFFEMNSINPNEDYTESEEAKQDMDIYYNAKQHELYELEEKFKENGYTKEMIEEIKFSNGAMEIEDFIDNLDRELSSYYK